MQESSQNGYQVFRVFGFCFVLLMLDFSCLTLAAWKDQTKTETKLCDPHASEERGKAEFGVAKDFAPLLIY